MVFIASDRSTQQFSCSKLGEVTFDLSIVDELVLTSEGDTAEYYEGGGRHQGGKASGQVIVNVEVFYYLNLLCFLG